MTSFEKEFPSLKGKGSMGCNPIDCKKEGIAYLEKDIKEVCLDKQKVLDVIKKCSREDENNVIKGIMIIGTDSLMEELGL